MKTCETELCGNEFIPKKNQRFCKECAAEREKQRCLNRETRSVEKRRQQREAKRVKFCKLTWCGRKLSKLNFTGKCFHHDSHATLHDSMNLYTPTAVGPH